MLTVVNFRLAPEEIAYVLSDSESELLLVGAPFVEVVAGLRDRLPLLREVVVVGEEYEAWLAAASPVVAARTLTPTPRCCSCTRRARPGSRRA